MGFPLAAAQLMPWLRCKTNDRERQTAGLVDRRRKMRQKKNFGVLVFFLVLLAASSLRKHLPALYNVTFILTVVYFSTFIRVWREIQSRSCCSVKSQPGVFGLGTCVCGECTCYDVDPSGDWGDIHGDTCECDERNCHATYDRYTDDFCSGERPFCFGSSLLA